MNRRPAVLTGSVQDAKVSSFVVRQHVKIVQRGTIAVTGTATSATATITAVNTANAVVFYDGFTTSNNGAMSAVSPKDYCFTLALTNSTTITATRAGNSSNNTYTIAFEVVEYWPGVIRSVTYGTITVANPGVSGTATVALNDVTKCQLSWLGFNTDLAVASQDGSTFVKIVITNTTTITATVNTAGANWSANYCVVEWNS